MPKKTKDLAEIEIVPNTKWSILEGRLEELNRQANMLAADMAWMARTPCGLNCSGCGLLLVTEADFARHFVISDFDLRADRLNLGDCPVNPRNPDNPNKEA